MLPDADRPLLDQPDIERIHARGILATATPLLVMGSMCLAFATGRYGIRDHTATVAPLQLDATGQGTCVEPMSSSIISFCLDFFIIWPLGVAMRAKWNFLMHYKYSIRNQALYSFASGVGLFTYIFMDSLQNGDIACMPVYKALPIGTIVGLVLASVNWMLPKRKIVADFAIGEMVRYTGAALTWPNLNLELQPNHIGLVIGAGTFPSTPTDGEGVDVLPEGHAAPITIGAKWLTTDMA